jgi:hypothetical protein
MPKVGGSYLKKCLLAQTLCWSLVLNPRNTGVFLRFKAHQRTKIRRVIQLCWETRPRRDFEPKSLFLRWLPEKKEGNHLTVFDCEIYAIGRQVLTGHDIVQDILRYLI